MNLSNKSVTIYQQHHHRLIASSTHFLSLFFFSFYPFKPTTTFLFSLRKTLISTMSEPGGGAVEDLTVNAEPEPITTVDPIVVESSPPVDVVDDEVDEVVIFGFTRSEMFKEIFPKTAVPYDRHVFLAFKSAVAWPARVEDATYDPLPAKFDKSLKKRKDQFQRKTRFTLIQGSVEAGISDGDLLIFPEMVKYKNLTHEAVDDFVEDVLVKETTSQALGNPDKLTGFHLFVCAHGSRDKRCGVCGPILVKKIKEEIEVRGLKEQVFVSPCSHIGGHKYAGNVIVFGANSDGQVMGHWYGYVRPDDVHLLLDQHIGKGEIIRHLWRGEVCGEKKQESKPQESNGEPYLSGMNLEKNVEEIPESITERSTQNGGSCCQGSNGFTCCQDEKVDSETNVGENKPKKGSNVCARGMDKVSAWMGKLEQSDVLAGVAVIGVAASVAVAYNIYRKSG